MKKNYFLNFNKSPSLLNCNISSFTFAFNESIDFIEVSAEGIIGIDDGKTACIPTDFSVLSMPVPEGFGDEEIVVFDLSSEW